MQLNDKTKALAVTRAIGNNKQIDSDSLRLLDADNNIPANKQESLKKNKEIVRIPHTTYTELELSYVPAKVLKILLSKFGLWVSSAELKKSGINSVSYAVNQLIKEGLIISSKVDEYIDEEGYRATGVKHYKYGGNYDN